MREKHLQISQEIAQKLYDQEIRQFLSNYYNKEKKANMTFQVLQKELKSKFIKNYETNKISQNLM